MAQKLRPTFFLYLLISISSFSFCAFLSHHYLYRHLPLSLSSVTFLSSDSAHHPDRPITATVTSSATINHAMTENLTLSKFQPPSSLSTVSLLLPGWEVLVIVAPEHTPAITPGAADYFCLFPNNDVSPAKPAGVLPFPGRATFKCLLPDRIRSKRPPHPKPLLTTNPTAPAPEWGSPAAEMFRWTYVAYDSLTTEEDVVVLVKGLNHRQGVNREPSGLNCVFYRGDDVDNGVRTAVTSSMQEVFRCQRPRLTVETVGEDDQNYNNNNNNNIKVTLETVGEKRAVVPTVAYYTPPRKLAVNKEGKALLCASTMVYNVAKFLKEWVMYHSKIGVEKFLIYDNGSDDDLEGVVEDLVEQGYDVSTYFWYWPKTQEAGFSHSAVYAKDSCTWTAFIDVDEFIYSPTWSHSSSSISIPSKSISMLHSILPPSHLSIGQLHIDCREFGPSNRTHHPPQGVMRGYNCRRRRENRHKSIVLLDAVDDSLLNVIHHFKLKKGYSGRKLSIRDTLVNHYKFQAWPEFKAKFRRRVSAYVVDWTQKANPRSNDRTPGLGFSAVEPQGWPSKFCEVVDNRLKDLTRKWFALQSPSGYEMPWQG